MLFGIHAGSSNMKISVFLCQSEDRFILMKTKYPVHIMVFGVVSRNRDIMSLFIFPHGLRLNIKCLEEVMLPYIERVAAGRPVRLAVRLCHTTNRRTLCWLLENFCGHITPNIWLPNSPNCNPFYYYVWDVVE